jgi:hypothetical protein
MRIESIKIQYGPNVQELVLSTDVKKNVNFVIGKNATGKSRTFNEIKSHFLNNNTDAKIEIKLTDPVDYSHIELMFIDDGILDVQKLLNKKKLPHDDLLVISQRANQILSTIGGAFKNNKNSLELQDKKIIINDIFAASPKTTAFYALAIAIREQIEPNLPMIIDDGSLSRLNHEFLLKTIEMLAKNVTQLLIFLTDVAFVREVKYDENNLPSLSEFLAKNELLGNVYILENHEFMKYE